MTITSANPDDLDHYVDATGRRRRTLQQRLARLSSEKSAVVAACQDFCVQSNVLGTAGRVFDALEQDERFVDKVSDTLRKADRDPRTGVASISSAAVAAALRAAGLASRPGPVEVEPGVLLGIPPTSGFVDDPICAANGNFVEVETDLAFPGRTAVLDVVRVYNSLAASRIGAFGPGWTSPLDLRVEHVAGGTPLVHLADGAVVPFHDGGGGDGLLRPRGRRPLTLEPSAAGWRLREGPTKTWSFDEAGRFVGGTAGGARLEVARDEAGRVVALTEARSGRSVRFEWEGGRVVRAAASDGRVVSYRYEDGVLVGVDRPGGGRSYGIDDDGRVETLTDADGVTLARNVYDESGRVLEQTNELGRTTRYDYGEFGTTVVSDTIGGPRNAFTHDRHGNVTAVVDGTGRALRLEYDDDARVTRITDRDGAVRRLSYDDRGNLSERVDPDGLRTRWEWDDRDRLVREVHRNGAVTTYEYEGEHRRPSRIVEPGDAVLTIELDELGQPTSMTDADGVTTTFEWDDDGQMTASIDALGNRTEISYDAAGLVERVVDGSGVVTELRSDGDGRVVEAVVAEAISRFAYTPAGRPVAGADGAGVSWTAAYGPHGRVAAFTDGAGSTVGFDWDALGNLVGVVAPDGERYEHEYDPAGRLVVARDPLGRESRRAVDPEGRVVGVSDPAGRAWQRRLDGLGRTASIVGPDGATTRYEYHFNGVSSRVVAPDGGTVTTEVDAAGRVVAVVDQLGGRFEIAYTPAGRPRERRSPTGRVERWEYDAAGRLVGVVSPSGERRAVLDGRGRIVRATDEEGERRYSYNAAGEVVSVDGPDGAASTERDAAGRVTAVVDGEGVRSSFRWDERGLLAGATDGGGATAVFERDVRGRVARAIDARGEATSFGYDRTGFLASVTDPTGTVARVLDPGGILLAQRYGDGSVLERTVDAAGRTLAAAGGDGTPIAQFGYDAAGRLADAVRVAGDVRSIFAWDARGRLDRVDSPTGVLEVGRDADGVVTSTRVGDIETRYVRDAAGRILEVEDADAGRVAAPLPSVPRRDRAGRITGSPGGAVYRYDEAGRLVEALDERGRGWTFAYGADGLLAAEDGPLGRRRYHRGFLGRLERIEEGDGTETRFSYDAAGRRTTAVSSDGRTVRWEWDVDGALVAVERTGPEDDTQRLDLVLDAFGRPVLAGGVEVQWDDAITGKPLRIGSTRYLHAAGRVRPARPAGSWSAWTGDPWGSDDADGVGLGYRDELAAWGLVWMGARVYDARTREFLAPDPLPPVPGRAGFASSYAYGFLDPVNHLDPSGRRPISQAEFDQIREREERGRFGQAWKAITDDPWGTLAMVGVIAVGVGLMFTPAAGIGAGILVGAAVPAMAGLVSGSFDPRAVALGGAVGAIPGGNTYRSAIAVGAFAGAGSELGLEVVRGDGIDVGNILTSAALGGATGGALHGVSVRIQGARATVEAPAAPTSRARFVVDSDGVVTDLGPRVSHDRPIVIGEGMDRVRTAAREMGADWYQPPVLEVEAQSLAHNRYWINEMMNQGRGIIDIGPAMGRANYPEVTSPWFGLERDAIRARDYPWYVQRMR